MDWIEQFRAAMHAAGLDYTGPIYADGHLQRFKASGDRARNSWYVLQPDPLAVGVFGCWKRQFKEKWHGRDFQTLTSSERETVRRRIAEAELQRKRAEKLRQRKARKVAQWILSRSMPADSSHAYLGAKGVQSHGELRMRGDQLVLPLRDIDGELHSLQFIGSGGFKMFLRGGRIRECFYTLVDTGDGPIVIAEGYATAASISEATGYASIAAMDCGNLLAVARAVRAKFPGRDIIIAADNDGFTVGKDGKPHNPGLDAATKAAKAIGARLAAPHFKNIASKPTDFNDLHQLEGLNAVKTQIEAAASQVEQSQPRNVDAMQAALNDARPKLRLPGDDRLVSDVGRELGGYLKTKDIFNRIGEVVILDGETLKPVDPQTFRSWIEMYVICYRQRTFNDNTYEVDVTMKDDEARSLLASPQFRSQLRLVRRLNRARLPVTRAGGEIELLPLGYDSASQTLTLPGVEYADDMVLADAVAVINDLFGEFAFTDARSKSVAVAALVGLYVNQLLPDKSLRAVIIFLANAEGAGKSMLAACCIVPVLGEPPTGCKAKDDDEMRKLLLACVREAKPVLLLDNAKGHLSSEALEAFASAPVWSDRKLGVSETVTGDNLTTIFITANGLTVSPDMRRRSLFGELHLECERAEDRVFKRTLDVPTLLAMRPTILAALWSLVRHWNEQGRPTPTRSHSAFPSWAQIVGGIVESAGFGCPLETAAVVAAADQDGESMRVLVSVMPANLVTFGELVTLAQTNGCFDWLLGDNADAELGRREKSTFAKLLTRYDRRLVGNHRFLIEGKGHGRRYFVEASLNQTTQEHGQHGQHGVSANKGKTDIRETDGNTMQTMQPCASQPEPEAVTNDIFRV